MKRIRYAVLTATVLACAAGVVAVVSACGDDDDSVSPKPDAGLIDTGATPTAPTSTGNPPPASDGSCPAAWTVTPDAADPSLAPEAGVLGPVIFHGQVLVDGGGTQNYRCLATDDAGVTYAWTLVAPEAELVDCQQRPIIHHFASAAGAARPEWQLQSDDSYVIGKRLAGFTPPGGGSSVPWLLLQTVSTSDGGALSTTKYIQRLYTDGGVGGPGCSAANADAGESVPYTADYYFYGPPGP